MIEISKKERTARIPTNKKTRSYAWHLTDLTGVFRVILYFIIKIEVFIKEKLKFSSHSKQNK